MADLFAGLDGQPGPFSEVKPTQAEAPQDSLSQFRQAQVAAMANLDANSDVLFDEFKQLQDQYAQNIQQYGESQVRTEAAGRRTQRRVQALQDLINDDRRTDPFGELQASARLAMQQEIEADQQRRAEAALEQEAVDNILNVAARDPHQANTLLNLMELGAPIQQIADTNAKYLILQREIDKIQSEVATQSWFRHAVDFTLGIIPLKASMGMTGNIELKGNEFDNWFSNLTSQVFAGDRKRAEAASIWDLDPESFSLALKDALPRIADNAGLLGYTSRSAQLDILTNLKETERPLFTNAFNFVDNVGVVAGVGKAALRGGVSVPAMLLRAGGRKQAQATMAHAAAELANEGTEAAVVKAGMTSTQDLTDGLSTSVMRVEASPYHVSPQAGANDILDRARGLLDRLPQWLQPGRFTNTEEYRAAVAKFIREETDRFDNRVVDVAEKRVRTADGSSVTGVEFTLGKTDATGYASEAAARRYANGLGFGDAAVIKSEDGQWFVKVSRNMPETGAYTNRLNVQHNSIMKRFLSGARERSDIDIANMATRADATRNRIINDVVRKLWKDVQVDPASRERLSNLWQIGENQGKWWNLDEANILYQRTYKRDISDKEWAAYQGLRNINDVEYIIRNDIMWKEKVIRGVETGTIDLGPGGRIDHANMVFDENFTKGNKGRAINASDGTIYTEDLSAAEIEQLKNQGFIRLHLEEPYKVLTDGSEVHTVIVRRQDVLREQLTRQQLAYRPGGHRISTEKYFGKQTNRGTQPDGSTFLKSPNTYIVGTKAQVDEWTRTMEQMRLAVVDRPNITAEELDNIVAGRVGYPTGQQFLDGVEAGTYRTDEAFGTYFDREMPEAYHAANNPFVDMEEDGFTQYARTHGRLYYSKKSTTGLVDWQGAQAPTLDAWQSTNRAFVNIANLSSFSDYKLSAIDRWANTFDQYIKPDPTLKTPMQRFMHGVPNDLATQHQVKQAMLDQRDIIKRNLGWKTEGEMQVAERQRRFAEWIMGSDPNSVRHGASRAILNYMEDKNPLGYLRGWAFDLKLGMFNPVQLFLQANTYFAMAAIDPAGAARGIQVVPMLRAFLHFSGDEGRFLSDVIKTGGHKLVGFDDAEEFSAFMKHAKQSGFFSLNDSHTLINGMGNGGAFTKTGSKIDELRQAGRFFFNVGEIFNRMVAYRSAWRKASKEFDLDVVSPDEFLNVVQGRAEDLALSVSRTSQAWWQQGLASLPTQFFAYQARMLEAMLGGFTGKGRFTREEAWRLILTQAFMYGTAGIPLAPVVSDFIKERTGQAPDLNTPLGWIDRGFMDNMWSAITGGSDMLISDRLGTGGWLGDTVGELMGYSKYGDTSTLDVLGGATWSISSDVWEDIGPVIKYTLAESGQDTGNPMTERAFENLAKNITSVSTALKFHTIMNYGYIKSGSGNIQATDLPEASAWATLLWGAQPGSMDDLGAMVGSKKQKDKVIEDAAKVITQYRQEMLAHPDRVQELSEEISLFTNLLDEDVRRAALIKAHDRVDPSLYASYAKRRERERQQKSFMEPNQ